MACKNCGFPIVYAKGYCRNCYTRDLNNGSPDYKRRKGEPSEKQSAILEFYNKVKNVAEVAKEFNCSRQYIYEVLHQYKKPTNADRIRSMTDEELANELGFVAQDAFCYGRGWRDKMILYPFGSYEDALEWLKQEAE